MKLTKRFFYSVATVAVAIGLFSSPAKAKSKAAPKICREIRPLLDSESSQIGHLCYNAGQTIKAVTVVAEVPAANGTDRFWLVIPLNRGDEVWKGATS